MVLDKRKELQQYFISRSQYFKNIEFFVLAEDYEKAAYVIGELISIIEKVEAPIEEEKNDG